MLALDQALPVQTHLVLLELQHLDRRRQWGEVLAQMLQQVHLELKLLLHHLEQSLRGLQARLVAQVFLAAELLNPQILDLEQGEVLLELELLLQHLALPPILEVCLVERAPVLLDLLKRVHLGVHPQPQLEHSEHLPPVLVAVLVLAPHSNRAHLNKLELEIPYTNRREK
jgi:hypothetical protein